MKARKLCNLSSFLADAKEVFKMHTTSTFWFGSMLSLAEAIDASDIHDDTTLEDKIEIIKMISHCVCALAAFYEKEIPDSVFKLLNFVNYLFDILTQCPDHTLALAKANYHNIVALYAIKTRQYNFALQVFNDIFALYSSHSIDCNNQYFLTAFSNYLSFLRKCSKRLASRMLQVQSIVSELFSKFLRKVILQQTTVQIVTPRIGLLCAVFHQNSSLLVKYEKDLNSLITHFYQSSKKKLPDNMIEFIYKNKITKTTAFQFSYNLQELKYYSGTTNHRRILKIYDEEPVPALKLADIQNMVQKSLELLTQHKSVSNRYTTLQTQIISQSYRPRPSPFLINKSTVPQVQPQPVSLQTLQPLPRSMTRKRESMIAPKVIKPVPAPVSNLKAITFKIHSIFIDLNEDGMLVSDYTKQNKRYVQWNTVSLIMERIELHFPFQEFLKVPMQNYYDFVRIIAFYLVKSDSREILLSARPLPLLQVNQLIRLFKQQGKYLKLALMNPYDAEKFVGVIDCYLSEYDEFFKCLHQNEFLGYLNNKISRSSDQQSTKQQNIYRVDFLKKRRDTTVAELGNQLHTESLGHALEQKGSLYKAILLLKNNLQIYAKILDNVSNNTFQNYSINVKIQNLKKELYAQQNQQQSTQKIDKLVQIPICKLLHFFPHQNSSVKQYLLLYSRMILDILNRFESYSEEINLSGLGFQVQLHASRTQIIEYGKYYTVVSAELVGSAQRVWALIIRYYDMAFLNYKMTIMMNPYHDFLQGIMKCSSEQKDRILKNLLVNESVKDTFNWLKKTNKLDSRINLFEYLYANSLI